MEPYKKEAGAGVERKRYLPEELHAFRRGNDYTLLFGVLYNITYKPFFSSYLILFFGDRKIYVFIPIILLCWDGNPDRHKSKIAGGKMSDRERKGSELSARRVTVKVFNFSKQKLLELESRLVNDFKQRAEELGIPVKKGSKGNVPMVATAIDLLIFAWDRLDEPKRDELIKEYIENYRPPNRRAHIPSAEASP